MAQVILAFRKISEATGCAIILIHHCNRNGGFRGSSAIENMVDSTFTVERVAGSDEVVMKPGKMRNAQMPRLKAKLWFTHKSGSQDLAWARFYGMGI